jgi:transposase
MIETIVGEELEVALGVGRSQRVSARSGYRHGARLEPLTSYSPEFNPIEQCWAKLKTALHQAGACTRRGRNAALKRPLKTITPADAQAWFTQCGYPVHP